LTDARLEALGVGKRKDRELVLLAVRKAGYEPHAVRQASNIETVASSSKVSSFYLYLIDHFSSAFLQIIVNPMVYQNTARGDSNYVPIDGSRHDKGHLDFGEVFDEAVR
jgi:hypothetical protein